MSKTTHEDVAVFYDEVYHAAATAEPGVRNRHLEKVAKALPPGTSRKVLDVACGTGDWLRLLSERGYEPNGLDISNRAIEICRPVMPQGDFRTGPAENLPYPDDYFDLVTCMGSLEHFLDQSAALREMVRVAKADATVLILVPNAGFPPYRLGLYRGTHQTAVRETFRFLGEWEQMLEDAGLEVVERRKDLHVISRAWICRKGLVGIPARLAMATMLLLWPLDWQYQVYFHCRLRHGA